MLPYMKHQTKVRRRSKGRLSQQSENRKQAVGLLREGWNFTEACRKAGVPKFTVSRLSHYLMSENEEAIEEMTSTKAKRASAAIISEAPKVINNCLMLAAERAFAVDTDSLKFVVGCIASDRRIELRGLQSVKGAVMLYRT